MDYYAKHEFHRTFLRRLSKLAKLLNLPKGTFEVRSNKGGDAVSGEVTLHSENLYVQVGFLAQPQSMQLLLAENDLITVTVEIPAGKLAPAGNPAARLMGFLNLGGQGTRPPKASPVTVQHGAAGYNYDVHFHHVVNQGAQ